MLGVKGYNVVNLNCDDTKVQSPRSAVLTEDNSADSRVQRKATPSKERPGIANCDR